MSDFIEADQGQVYAVLDSTAKAHWQLVRTQQGNNAIAEEYVELLLEGNEERDMLRKAVGDSKGVEPNFSLEWAKTG